MVGALLVVGGTIIGGFTGLLVAVLCEEIGIVRYPQWTDSLGAAFMSIMVGGLAGGVLGLVSAVRLWLRRPPGISSSGCQE
jgi:hypothetical protein